MKTPVYLDYAATTPCAPEVISVINQHLSFDDCFANPASRSHFFGWQAESAVEKARKQVATLLNADTREIIWTSGATEANNLAIKGYALANSLSGKHLICSLAEHKAVIDCFKYLQEQGFDVSWLKPESNGSVSLETIRDATRDDTILISCMHVNNETGAVTNIEQIAEFANEKGICFHVDAAQSAGKLILDLSKIKVDLLSMSAHKIYGPKGIGALFVRKRPGLKLNAQIHGGGHEQGLRSGTLPTHQIAGMGMAFELAAKLQSSEYERLSELQSVFLSLVTQNTCVIVNSDREQGYPGIINLAFKGIDGQILLSALPMLAVSSGSACNSATVAPSHVLIAMGLSEENALSALRFSFGRNTSKEEVIFAAETLLTVLEKLQS